MCVGGLLVAVFLLYKLVEVVCRIFGGGCGESDVVRESLVLGYR